MSTEDILRELVESIDENEINGIVMLKGIGYALGKARAEVDRIRAARAALRLLNAAVAVVRQEDETPGLSSEVRMQLLRNAVVEAGGAGML